MKEITTYKGLFAELEKVLMPGIKQVAEEIKSVLRQYIYQEIYMTPESPEYRRTENFIDSLTVSDVSKKGEYFSAEVYFDVDKIIPEERDGWNAHMSTLGSYAGDTSYAGKPIGWHLIRWLEYGNRSPFSRPGTHFFEQTVDFIKNDQYHITRLKEIFLKKGFVIE